MNDHTQSAKPMFADIDADFDIVIVGSGPAGLSAASRAKELGCRHVLFEAEQHPSDTIHKYQKHKHVMAEPSILPLRSSMRFGPGKRETVLDTWTAQLVEQQVNIQYNKRVNHISRDEATRRFIVRCEDGSECTSRSVIVAIGLQGNIRRLGVTGENLERVQYTLADPDEFSGETIVVVGAGDAGIENALALARQNSVIVMNRNDEFAICKDRNREDILAADKAGRITICYNAKATRVEEISTDLLSASHTNAPLRFVYNGRDGEEVIACHRVIARLGATPPRKLVESFGIVFPNPNPTTVPVLSPTYESNVPGLFIVGALGGYPLIKQAMNQGYEVVQTILGMPVEPADEPLLRAKFQAWMPGKPASQVIAAIAARIPLFRAMSALQLREFILDSNLLTPGRGSIIFKKFDYTNTFYSIIEGEVECEIDGADGKPKQITLGAGQYFGEMALISGRRRVATVRAASGCVLLETPRRSMVKLINSVDDVQQQMDEVFIHNAISSYFGSMIGADGISALMAGGVELRRYNANQVLFSEGDEADGLYLIRRGSVIVAQKTAGRDRILCYVSAGNYVGEMALINDALRSATVTAAVMTEVLILKTENVRKQLADDPSWHHAIREQVFKRTQRNIVVEENVGPQSDLIRFLIGQGVGEASDVLLIDESICIQCNNCETACAETHNGTSRLQREIGPTFANIHLPSACRHCEHPQCMKDCPPDAISRAESGEVFISDACIGCGNCERNCPYSVIQMAVEKPPKAGGGLSWLLFGLGEAPGQRQADYDPNAQKKAVKCDLCKGLAGGASCVKACPTGAAIRISPENFFKRLNAR